VFTDACACPFCQATLPEHSCEVPASAAPRRRLGRGARVIACASLVGASACFGGSSAYGTSIVPPFDAGGPTVDAGTDSGVDQAADGATDGAGDAGATSTNAAGSPGDRGK
jgi:hypothetical protein